MMTPSKAALVLSGFLATPLLAQAKPVAAPANMVPQQAVAYGAEGSPATAVTATNPLPAADPNNAPFVGAETLTVGSTATARRSIALNCTVAGNAVLRLSDASTLIVPAAVGLAILPLAVTQVVTAGTTATCTYSNLK